MSFRPLEQKWDPGVSWFEVAVPGVFSSDTHSSLETGGLNAFTPLKLVSLGKRQRESVCARQSHVPKSRDTLTQGLMG